MTADMLQATNPPLGRKFTQADLDACWEYAHDYFLQILNGEYDVLQARDDLTGLITFARKTPSLRAGMDSANVADILFLYMCDICAIIST